MSIKWAALAETAGVSFVVTVATVAVFALGILALSRREAAQEAAATGTTGSGTANLALAGASVCFAACASVVGYGLFLIAG
ncbi:hypothetical protein ASE03_04205 [Kitasatospora sp. Root187]|nr:MULTISPECIES: hypothetical protein [unclassified Kitasatospora]KQV24257.1 hypothetical protein ASC99_00530 [Kitasatospora sp. Root107]KRB67689.1 hypothetical protein ASE03_04205 [Kitasatospora sp. Root187]